MKTRSRSLAFAGIVASAVLACAPLARGQYAQTPLTISTGFNQDVVIEAAAKLHYEPCVPQRRIAPRPPATPI